MKIETAMTTQAPMTFQGWRPAKWPMRYRAWDMVSPSGLVLRDMDGEVLDMSRR